MFIHSQQGSDGAVIVMESEWGYFFQELFIILCSLEGRTSH